MIGSPASRGAVVSVGCAACRAAAPAWWIAPSPIDLPCHASVAMPVRACVESRARSLVPPTNLSYTTARIGGRVANWHKADGCLFQYGAEGQRGVIGLEPKGLEMAKNAIAKNTICLWYDKDAEAAARFYAETFPDSAVGAVHRAPGDFP